MDDMPGENPDENAANPPAPVESFPEVRESGRPENPGQKGPMDSTWKLLDRFVGGDQESIRTLILRHDLRLHKMASRLIRCIEMYDAAYDADDAVNHAWAAICLEMQRGEIASVQDSMAFWKRYAVILRNEILRQNRRYKAARRGGRGLRREWESWRRAVGAGADMPQGRGYRCSADHLDGVYASLPPPEDLALAQLEVESLVNALEDPDLRTILEMRIESYTNAEIAELLDVNVRTIERKMGEIRERYLRLARDRQS